MIPTIVLMLIAYLSTISAAPAKREIVCNSAGQTHKPGDVWVQRNRFKMKCDATGLVTILGCHAPQGFDIALGQTVTRDGFNHICEIKQTKPVFYEYRIEAIGQSAPAAASNDQAPASQNAQGLDTAASNDSGVQSVAVDSDSINL